MSTVLGPTSNGTGQTITDESPEGLAKQLADLRPSGFNKEAKNVLDVAIVKLITFSPIYGVVFMYLNKRQSRDLPTMGVGITDRVNLALFYNPEFVLSLESKELRAVLQHEALHVLLHHITRREHFNYQPIGYNVAADLAINCHLSNLPPKVLYPKTFGLQDFEASEWYYEQLKEMAEKNSANGQGGQGGGIPFFVEGKGEMVGDHSKWGECEDDIIKEKIRNIADTAIREQGKKGWSDIGDSVSKAIIEANKSQLNWRRELRYFINKVVEAGKRSTRTRINRREHSTKTTT